MRMALGDVLDVYRLRLRSLSALEKWRSLHWKTSFNILWFLLASMLSLEASGNVGFPSTEKELFSVESNLYAGLQ